MIKEKSSYLEDLPINIRIAEIEEYPLHFHQDIEFVYVLKGDINLKCGYFTYHLTEGSVFTLNGREVHGLYHTGQDNIIALVQINNYYFSRYFNRLSGSCFRTYTNDMEDERLEALRLYFIEILLETLKKEPGYKRQTIDLILRLLAYLEESFHYFSFENKVVVNTRNDNTVSVERLGRIINFIYEKHAEKITLKDLSELEHLSTYYISHLITKGTGMNFREFLCFARVEFSEMILLDTNKKVNEIAQEVGFSTTSYYIKYFKKWFGMNPEEYRRKYWREIKAPNIPVKLRQMDPDTIFKILYHSLDSLTKQKDKKFSAGSHTTELYIDCYADPLGMLNATVIPHCKESQLLQHFSTIISIAHDLKIKEIRIIPDEVQRQDSIAELAERLMAEGIHSKIVPSERISDLQNFALDSIAAVPCLLRQGLNPDCSKITMNSFIDSRSPSTLLKGEDGIYTSGLVPKPSYFAYKMLQYMNGALIQSGKFHAFVRKPSGNGNPDAYCIVCHHHNEEVINLCEGPFSIEETKKFINKFSDTLDIGIHLNGLTGTYQIIKYRLNPENSLLDYAVNNGLSREIGEEENRILTWLVSPKVDISTETLAGSVFFNIALKGSEALCIQIIPV